MNITKKTMYICKMNKDEASCIFDMFKYYLSEHTNFPDDLSNDIYEMLKTLKE